MPKHIAQQLLETFETPEVAADIFANQIQHKPLILRPTSPEPNSQDARAQRRRRRLHREERIKRRNKVKPLSAREKRLAGLNEAPACMTYDVCIPLHQLWVNYMQDILGIVDHRQQEKDAPSASTTHITASSKGAILASADYHGANMTVVRSRCSGLVGLQGIVVRDTKFTLQLVTPKNESKIVPKAHTIFRFEIPSRVSETDSKSGQVQEVDRQGSYMQSGDGLSQFIFEIHGSQFENRASDRATRKFKAKALVDL